MNWRLTRRLNSRGKKAERGATAVEMVLIGIPMIFMLISIFEISRGMWVYHTCAYSVKSGVRFAIVHGINCVNTTSTGGTNPNNCAKNISDIAAVIQNAAVGLDARTTRLTFTPQVGAATTCLLSACLAAPYTTTQWPPSTANAVGKVVRIDIITPFLSALGMFWPGSKPVGFASLNFGASSSDYIQF